MSVKWRKTMKYLLSHSKLENADTCDLTMYLFTWKAFLSLFYLKVGRKTCGIFSSIFFLNERSPKASEVFESKHIYCAFVRKWRIYVCFKKLIWSCGHRMDLANSWQNYYIDFRTPAYFHNHSGLSVMSW